jgi:hypothetical protein
MHKTSNRETLAAAMPAIMRHEGTWEGIYRRIDLDGAIVDRHRARIICTFPESGPYAYIQYNEFTWDDGRTQRAELPGILRDGKIWWDLPTFSGYAWETLDGVLLLHLTRKDEPGATFIEAIVLAPDGRSRARTWHWFKSGRLYQRTLCDEARLPD